MNTKRRVLIIDDESDIRDGASLWLKARGYDTACAEDGEAGFESAQADPPDAILLDVLMPKKDGMQTLAALQASPRTKAIPVVMLSASLRDEQRALEAGARFFVQKPYDGKKLSLAVGVAIDGNTSNSAVTNEI